MRYIVAALLTLLSFGYILVCLGKVSVTSDPLPPLAKILHPVDGLWSNTTTKAIDQTIVSDIQGQIVYDDRLVPRIFADNMVDASYLQGYAEAQHRLFQMDFISRVASSRLSEVMGKLTLDTDRSYLRKQTKDAAESLYDQWKGDPKMLRYYQSYADGVNAYINSLSPADYPYEYKLLDFAPEEWTVLKSCYIFKYMTNVLAGSASDIGNTNMLQQLGRELFDHIYPERVPSAEVPVVPTGAQHTQSVDIDTNSSNAKYNEILFDTYFDHPKKGIGSNNWAVQGSKSATGLPIVACDPHLSLSLPSIWFESQIITPSANAYGVSFPGLPGLMFGFNNDIAWGETNSSHDVLDYFVIKWANQEKTKYYVDGKVLDAEQKIHKIAVKGKEPYLDTMTYTIFGPVVKESVDGKHDLAAAWIGNRTFEKSELNTFIDILGASTYDQFKEMTGGFHAPAQNFIFGGRQGDIAIRVNGTLPARSYEDGRFVEWGDSESNLWQTFIPRDENPQVINPPSQFVTSSNQMSTDTTYPYYYTGTWERYRNRIIDRKLSDKASWTAQDFLTMQGNSYSVKAEDIMPTLLDLLPSDSLSAILKEWDYNYDREQEGPTVFEQILREAYLLTFDEVLSMRKQMDIKYPEYWRLIDLIRHSPDDKLFDKAGTSEVENAKDILLEAWQISHKKLKGHNLKWGSSRPMSFNHIARIPGLSRTNVQADGCGDAINATGTTFGPSWRMVVSFTNDGVEAYGVYPGGQSGNPLSPHYDDMLETWRNNKHYKLLYAKSPSDITGTSLTFTKD